MTEAEWQESANPEIMLDALRGLTHLHAQPLPPWASIDRKYRCFALACLPVILPFLYERSKHALSELEQIVEEKSSPEEAYAAWQDALAAVDAFLEDPSEQRWHYIGVYAADSVALALNPHPADNIAGAAARCCQALAAAGETKDEPKILAHEQRRQVHLIHEIFGNPFRPVTLDRNWLTPTVRKLAQAIYEERAFDRLSILADALEESGCRDEAILSHSRSAGPHVRGCWVVDLLLGKE